MASYRWTDEFLDAMRREGDARADDILAVAVASGEVGRAWRAKLFQEMDANDARPPEATFPTLEGFFKVTAAVPSDVEGERLGRGEAIFARFAYDGSMVLLAKSLPEGYQAPALTKILAMSGDLQSHTYRRLLATLQTVVNVSVFDGFLSGGRAILTAQKLRLLHAGVRRIAREALPDYEETYGVPVNQEDLLATIMGFSLLVIEGWEALGVPVSDEDKEDYLYLWLVFARMMGVHPPYDLTSRAYVPDDLADARAFYDAYRRRHYVGADENPEGVALAAANVTMLRNLIPTPLRWLGFGFVPRLVMHRLMGPEACRALGIRGVPLEGPLTWVLGWFHRVFLAVEGRLGRAHDGFSILLLQKLIDHTYHGRVVYAIPTQMANLRALVFRAGVPADWPSRAAESARVDGPAPSPTRQPDEAQT